LYFIKEIESYDFDLRPEGVYCLCPSIFHWYF